MGISLVAVGVVALLVLGAYIRRRLSRRARRQPSAIRQIRVNLPPELEQMEIVTGPVVHQPRAFAGEPAFSVFDLLFADVTMSRLEVGIPVARAVARDDFSPLESADPLPTAHPKFRSISASNIDVQMTTTVQDSRQISSRVLRVVST